MTDISCGIDFGTSNSTIGIAMSGATPALIPLEQGKYVMPSALFYKADGDVLFGRAAITAYLDGEQGRLMRGLKKILGTALMDDKTNVGKKSVRFTDMIATYLANLKHTAEHISGHKVHHVVMGRPVHFHDNNSAGDAQAEATLHAIAESVGFKNIVFLYEPIAAAFAHEARIEMEKLSLVVDLGGGTSDFSVIKIAKNKQNKVDRAGDILASTGVRVGGTQFDYQLSLAHFMPHLGLGSEIRGAFDVTKLLTMPPSVYYQLSDWAWVHQAQTQKAVAETTSLILKAEEPDKLERLLKLQTEELGHALLEVVEDTKIALTRATTHKAQLKALDADLVFKASRAGFERAISSDIKKIKTVITDCLKQAGVKATDIELVILTGGSTELPVVQDLITQMFPHATLSEGDKLDSVGLGLATKAAHMFKSA